VQGVLDQHQNTGTLPEVETANAFRALIGTGIADVATPAQALLGPAENYGGRLSFRYLVPLTALVALIFGVLLWQDRQRGGYKAERLGTPSVPAATG
jgi:hypothetical protein